MVFAIGVKDLGAGKPKLLAYFEHENHQSDCELFILSQF